MDYFAVAGNPILHSRSPGIFRAMFKTHGVRATHTRLRASTADEVLRLARALHLKGMSITSPLKEAVFSRLDWAEESCQKLGVVNTLRFEEEQVSGYNTDVDGARYMVSLSPVPLASRPVVLLGSGGAARAVALALESHGAIMNVVNRSTDRARDVASLFGGKGWGLDRLPSQIREADLLFSCLPRQANVVKAEWLRPDLVVMDANYGHTELLAQAQRSGCRVIDGTPWLEHQALIAFKIFTGIDTQTSGSSDKAGGVVWPPPEIQRVALIGMMGTGKTTAGRGLARKLGWKFIDTDERIEAEAGTSIMKIFEEDGEQRFRSIEHDVVMSALKESTAVIALGGGSVESETIRQTVMDRCLTVWLWGDPEELVRRTGGQHRPLLQGGDPLKILERLLERRREAYATASDLVIDTRRQVSEVTEDIWDEIHRIM